MEDCRACCYAQSLSTAQAKCRTVGCPIIALQKCTTKRSFMPNTPVSRPAARWVRSSRHRNVPGGLLWLIGLFKVLSLRVYASNVCGMFLIVYSCRQVYLYECPARNVDGVGMMTKKTCEALAMMLRIYLFLERVNHSRVVHGKGIATCMTRKCCSYVIKMKLGASCDVRERLCATTLSNRSFTMVV